MLGVSSISQRDGVKMVMNKERMTWSSWVWDGPNGAIAAQWKERVWKDPVYVIDHKGVIRFNRGFRGSGCEALAAFCLEIDEVVDLLLQELRADKEGGSRSPE